MKKKVCIVLAGLMLCNYAFAQSLRQYQQQRNQELEERRIIETADYEKACSDGSMDALKEYLSMYPQGMYVQEIESRIAEIERNAERDFYAKARDIGTVKAYKDYLRQYPDGMYVQESKSCIEDIELWETAKSSHTIEAYRNYLESSKNKSFAQLANDAIIDLESRNVWNSIRHGTSKVDVESFILKYPRSSCLPEAIKRRDELWAIELYAQGDLQQAYEKFESAGGRASIDPSSHSKYDECVEYIAFNQLDSLSSEGELLTFLSDYPDSKYSDQVSNMVAVKKAKSFSMFASSLQFNEALRYAKDITTQNIVQSYIDDTKRSYRQYKRRQQHNRIMDNGGYVKFGIEFLDFGFAEGAYYYNLGLSFKVGNYKAPAQLEIGVKPGMGIIEDEYGSYSDDYDVYESEKELKSFFHMPLYGRLKLNICSAGRSKFYIAGVVTYNAIRNEDYENKYSAGGGIGFAWKKWDWFTLYYKQDIGKKNELNEEFKFFGTSFVCYF